MGGQVMTECMQIEGSIEIKQTRELLIESCMHAGNANKKIIGEFASFCACLNTLRHIFKVQSAKE